MKLNRFLKVAAALWAVAVLTTAVWLPGVTMARYTARAGSTTGAQVAAWNPRIVPSPHGVAIRTNGNLGGFSHTSVRREFSVHNDSDVAAHITMFVLYARPAPPALVKNFVFPAIADPASPPAGTVVAQNLTFQGVGNTVINNGNGTFQTAVPIPPNGTASFRIYFNHSSVLGSAGTLGEKCRLYIIATQVD